MVMVLVPAAIVPVNVPPSVPLPVLRLKATPVLAATLSAPPLPFCACTTTEKAVPAVGLVPPFTEVMASVFSLKVAVTDCAALPIEKLQLLPLHPVTPDVCTLHPAN